MRSRYTFVMSTFLLFVALSATNVFAVTITPVKMEITCQPGEQTAVYYDAYNKSAESIGVNVSARTWYSLPENLKFAIGDWLTITPQEFVLGPGEHIQVECNVFVPERAKGELVAMISFVPESTPGSMINIAQSVSLYVAIKGTAKREARITDMIIRWDKKAIRTAVTVFNSGNIHLRPEGEVLIIRGRKEIVRLPLKSGWPVYPEREQAYFADWEEPELSKGKYILKCRVDCGDGIILAAKRKFRIGKDHGIELYPMELR